jgi:glycosyltransferase involved in cell wall biosynthesis
MARRVFSFHPMVQPHSPARSSAGAIQRLLADEELRQRLGVNGRRVVLERFTADQMTRAFEALYGGSWPEPRQSSG